MTWIAIDCDLFDHPKMVDLPNDSARYGWLVVLSKAKRQRNAGSFASAKHFSHVLGKFGKFANEYVKAGLLEKADDGTLTIHDWRKHQWAASKAKLRDEENDETSRGLNVDTDETSLGQAEDSRAGSAVLSPVLVDVDVSSPGVGSGAGGLVHLVEELTSRPFSFSVGSRPWQTLSDDVQALGPERVADAYRATAKDATAPLDAAGVIFGGHKRLYPIPTAPRSTPADTQAEREAAARAAQDRRVERTQRELAQLRGE